MPSLFDAVWRETTVIGVLLGVLWAGHKGWWYWSPGVKALATELARERDDWRALAVTLLRKQGVELPEGFEHPASIELPGEDDGRRRQHG